MTFRAASLVDLHAFVGVCKAGTMRQAAEQLCVTQAAVGRAVLRLEGRIGTPLFGRSAQGVVPNAQAQALRARIEPSLVELERALTELRQRRAEQRRILRICGWPLRMSVPRGSSSAADSTSPTTSSLRPVPAWAWP